MLTYLQAVSEIQTRITTKGQLILKTFSSYGLCHIAADLSKSAANRKMKLNELEPQKQLKASIISCQRLQRQCSE